MAKTFTSRVRWEEKLNRPLEPKVVTVPVSKRNRYGGSTLLISRPLDIDALVRTIKKGRLVTRSILRARLAADQHAEVACPLTTGIFLRIVAEAAEEALREGKSRVTPYWRVVADDGSLNPRYPGGVLAQAERLRDEGHVIEPARGKRPPKVKDVANRLTAL